MRHHLLSLVGLAVAITTSPLRAQETVPCRALVSTVGSAEIRVVPDLADLSFEVEIRNVNLAKARKDQADRVTKVLAALRRAGVIESELQTSQVEIVPHYEERDGASPGTTVHPEQNSATARFYSVAQQISCTLHDVKKVPNVTADAVTAGITKISGATLRTSEIRKYRDQGRAKAIRVAKEKALALAGELGAKVGRPYAITETAVDDRYAWPAYAAYAGGISQLNEGSPAPVVSENAEPAFAPGTISVTAHVSVSFVLE